MHRTLLAGGTCGGPPPGRRGPRALALTVLWMATAVASHELAAQTDADEEYVLPLVNQALETQKSGVEISWSNPATGSSGKIRIERTFYRDLRTPCRDYRRTLERVGARKVEIEGTGCRIDSGRWSLDEEKPGAAAARAPTPGAGSAPRSAEAAAGAPEPAAGPAPASCPALTAAPVPYAKPKAMADYTMPPRTEL